MSRVPSRPLDPVERRYRTALTLVCVLVTLVAAAWAVVTPGFRAPDETQHVNSVVRLAHGGGWPAPGEAYVSTGLAEAERQAARGADIPGRYVDRPNSPQLVDVDPVPDGRRAHLDGDAPTPLVDQMTQHPPLYYALGAAVLRVTGLADARWDVSLLALRLLDVALLAPLAPLAAAATRRLTGSRAAALAAATFPLLVPQAAHILGSVTNDALVTLSGAVVTYLCVRVLTGDLSFRTAALLGVVEGVGLLTKVMPGFALPTIVLSYLVARAAVATRFPGLAARAGRALVALTVAFAVGGWWWARNLLVHGQVQPVGLPPRLPDEEPLGLGHYLPTAWRMLTQSFWGNFGWLELRVSPVVVLVATWLLVAVCVAALASREHRRPVATLLLLPFLLALFVLLNGWSFYQQHGWIAAVQGRYLFMGLAALAVAFAVGLQTVMRHRPRALDLAAPVVVTAGVAVAAAGLAFAFAGMYRGPGESLGTAAARWVAWSPLNGVQAGLLLLVVAATASGAVLAATAFAREATRTVNPAATRPLATAATAATTAGTGAEV